VLAPGIHALAVEQDEPQKPISANDHIQIALIGAGGQGQGDTSWAVQVPGVKLVAAADCYTGRLEHCKERWGKDVFTTRDYNEILARKDIDAIICGCPDHWHMKVSTDAMNAGKDVYCEKPMTLVVDEGKWMIQAARKYKRIVTVGTQRRQGAGVKAAKKVVEAGTLGKIHSIRLSFTRNIYPGFGKTPVTAPPPGFDYDMWLGPNQKTPYQNHRGIYHFRWFWDFSGGQMTNLGAHQIDQILWLMDAKMPTLVMSEGGRYALDDDDGDTPDTQDAIWVFPGKNGAKGFTMAATVREACSGPRDAGGGGQVYMGTKGTMSVSGNYTVTSESKGDPVNDIPRFQGHPIGGPVYTQTPRTQWLSPEVLAAAGGAAAGGAGGGGGRGAGRGAAGAGAGAQGRGAAPAAGAGVATDSRYGLTATGADPTMTLNERDWLDCIKSRNRPFCEVEDGHKVATTCNLANVSLRLHRSIKFDPEKEVVIGDAEAAKMCTKTYRAPWDAALKACVKV
jgi:predicted dehydrogenase